MPDEPGVRVVLPGGQGRHCPLPSTTSKRKRSIADATFPLGKRLHSSGALVDVQGLLALGWSSASPASCACACVFRA
eukprot:scaffold146322_cov34-Tisochrysis_lutea.AAC.7